MGQPTPVPTSQLLCDPAVETASHAELTWRVPSPAVEMVVIGLLLLGEGWFLVYIVALVISLAIVIPKVRRLKQPVGTSAVACVALPLVTAAVVNWKID